MKLFIKVSSQKSILSTATRNACTLADWRDPERERGGPRRPPALRRRSRRRPLQRREAARPRGGGDLRGLGHEETRQGSEQTPRRRQVRKDLYLCIRESNRSDLRVSPPILAAYAQLLIQVSLPAPSRPPQDAEERDPVRLP